MADHLAPRLSEDEIRNISVLGLAHIGDAVHELMVRSWLVMGGRATARGLHKAAVGYVSAPEQARAAAKLMACLTEEEQAVFRRGRNTRVHSAPRSASRTNTMPRRRSRRSSGTYMSKARRTGSTSCSR